MSFFRAALSAALALVFGALAVAQPATEAQMNGVKDRSNCGTLHFSTRLGSFKMIDGFGRAEFTFTGTVLINRVDGTKEVTGNVRKEYEKGDRVIYFGTGKVVVTGSWRGIQWFGKDLSGVWFGRGVMRFAGEFDRDQLTGDYWFDDPSKKTAWPGGTTYDIPFPRATPGVNPNVKVKKKG